MPLEELRSTFTSTSGGVMTEEAGAITGEMELSTCPAGGVLEVLIRYAGAEEWYTVAGGPVSLESDAGHRRVHGRIVEHLKTPKEGASGNEEPVSLLSFSGNL